MELVGAILVDEDAVLLFRVTITAYMLSLIYNQDRLSCVKSFTGECRTKETAANYKKIVH
jgi:hypothetical protein